MSDRLRPYQVEGVGFLTSRPRALLADDMGLGKSAQLLTAASVNRGDTLVIAPAMVLDGGTWHDEAEKWCPEPSELVQSAYTRLGPQRLTEGQERPERGYWSQRKAWASLVKPELLRHWATVIFDEAHYLKGRGSLRSNYAQAIAAQADQVYLATGTPIPNFAHELFPLLQMLNPDQGRPGQRYGSYWKWVDRWFQVTKGRYSDYEIGGMLGCGRRCELHTPDNPCEHYLEFAEEELAGVFLKRRRDDVLPDLPPLTEVTVEVPMGPKQRAAYRELKKHLVTTINGSEVVAWSRSAAHVLLDQLTTGIGLVADGEVFNKRGEVTPDNAKLVRLKTDLESRSRPTLVVAHYQPTVEAAVRVARSVGAQAELVYGPTSRADRLRHVRAFQAGKLDVLVGSLETIAEGLTLVAADQVIFVEKSWKPSRNDQALRRIHRIGQQRPVTALDYVTPQSVDAGKRELLKLKTDHQMKMLTAADIVRIA